MAAPRNARSLVVAIVLAVGALVAAPLAPATAGAPAPARHHVSYAVGARTYTFVDKSRPTSPNGSYSGASTRIVPTLLLYPARGDPSGPVVEGAKPVRRRRTHGFPLIVFSHGFGASGPTYGPLLARFVREGYVVAAPTFPLSSGGAPGGPAIGDYVNQPADVSFVLSRLLRLARHDDSLRMTINRHHVGVAGHSLGAITTLGVATNSCCWDDRIDAAVSLSGIELPFPGGSFFATRTPPLMLVHGNDDHTVPYPGSANAYAQAAAPKAFLTLEDAGHVPFGPPWLDPTIRSITDFLDGYLEHDRAALRRLGSDGSVPGVASVQENLGGRSRLGGPTTG